MLQALREKTSGWIATVILGLLIVPLALFGLQDYMVQRTENYVARIDSPPSWWPSAPSWWPVSVFWEHEEVSTQEFRNAFELARQQQRTRLGERFDARQFESAANKRQLLDQMVAMRLQKRAAKDAGVTISDALVKKEILSIPAFQVDGKFNYDRYRLALSSLSPQDSIVRGTQLKNYTIKKLWECGAKEIHVRPACPPLLFPCRFALSTRSIDELAARKAIRALEGKDLEHVQEYIDHRSKKYQKMVDWIEKELGVTSLRYQGIDDMVEAIGLPREKLCLYCWMGND